VIADKEKTAPSRGKEKVLVNPDVIEQVQACGVEGSRQRLTGGRAGAAADGSRGGCAVSVSHNFPGVGSCFFLGNVRQISERLRSTYQPKKYILPRCPKKRAAAPRAPLIKKE